MQPVHVPDAGLLGEKPYSTSRPAPYLRCVAHALGQFERLSPGDLDDLDAGLAPAETLSADTLLMSCAAGQPFAILEGWAGLARIVDGAHRHITMLFAPGEMVGLDTAHVPRENGQIIALTAMKVRRLTSTGRAMISGNPMLVRAVAAQNRSLQTFLQDQVYRIGALQASERLAHLLHELDIRIKRAGPEHAARFALKQEVLAQTLGMSLVHINRTLKEIRRQGLVRFDRGRLIVPDPDRLLAATSPEPAHASASVKG